ncbi:MAG: hypothetical protein RL173_3212 [Fibrobacterota bacterium]|jgi:hypothetical protein
MKSNRLNLLTATVMLVALGMVATPTFAAKGKKKTADAGVAAPVEDAPAPESGAASAPEKQDPLPPISPDDTAFEPTKGRPEKGQPGKLEIITRPSGAEVYYADEYRGKTPLVVDATSGRDDLSLDLDGHNLYKSRVNVWPNQTTTLNIELKLPLGDIELTTNPPKASITLDGKPIGSTQGGPLTIRKVKDGGHVLCGSAGGKGGCETVQVQREATIKVKLNLR